MYFNYLQCTTNIHKNSGILGQYYFVTRVRVSVINWLILLVCLFKYPPTISLQFNQWSFWKKKKKRKQPIYNEFKENNILSNKIAAHSAKKNVLS